jgi:hypothetical protein
VEIIDWDDRGLSEDLEGLWIVYVMNHPDPSGDRGYERRSKHGAVQLAKDIYPNMSDSEAEGLRHHGRVNLYSEGQLFVTLTLSGTNCN